VSLRILLVDDDRPTLSAYQRFAATQYQVDTAETSAAALAALDQNGPYAVVVADMHMPETSGLDLLVEVRRRAPDTVRVMLTGDDDKETAAEAVNTGRVFSFLAKPCPATRFLAAMAEASEQYQLVRRERELLEQTFNGIVQMLSGLLTGADLNSFAASERLRERARALGLALRMPSTWEVEAAAMLLRVGLITIPAAVLTKLRQGEKLTDSEAALVHRVPEVGARLLEHVPRLAPVAEIVRHQKRNFDGSGAPDDGVAGTALPVGARVLRALTDLHDLEEAGTSPSAAVGRLRERQQLYDPDVLRQLERLFGTTAATAPADRCAVTVAELRPGMVTTENILSSEGATLLLRGTKMSPTTIERLRNFAELGHVREPVNVVPFDSPTTASN